MSDFLGKVFDSVGKGIATVSTGSKNMVEKNKYSSIIKGLEEEKRQLTEIAGKKVVAYCYSHAEGDIPRSEIESIYAEIVARDEQISVNKMKLAELETEMNQVASSGTIANVVCQCGHENGPGAKFCAKCGNRLAE